MDVAATAVGTTAPAAPKACRVGAASMRRVANIAIEEARAGAASWPWVWIGLHAGYGAVEQRAAAIRTA